MLLRVEVQNKYLVAKYFNFQVKEETQSWEENQKISFQQLLKRCKQLERPILEISLPDRVRNEDQRRTTGVIDVISQFATLKWNSAPDTSPELMMKVDYSSGGRDQEKEVDEDTLLVGLKIS